MQKNYLKSDDQNTYKNARWNNQTETEMIKT